MYDFEDVMYLVVGIWIIIVLFITCPIWFLPVAIYKRIKGCKQCE